jgi:predicted nucleic acid-binding protein
MKIYIDTCGWCRPYDDQKITRNAAEAIAIMSAIETCRLAGHCIVGSTAVMHELRDIKDPLKRAGVESFYINNTDARAVITAKEIARAQSLHAQGVGKKDSFHLAAAEAGGVDILLTTDGGFEEIVTEKNLSAVRVINPLKFLMEVLK